MSGTTQCLQDMVDWLKETVSDVWTAVENVPGGHLTVVALCAVTYISFRYMKSCYAQSTAKGRIAGRQAKAKNRHQKVRNRLEQVKGEIDLSITQLSFKDLQNKLQKGDLKARDVVLAYQLKAMQINDELNCITDFIDDAEDQAIELDKLSPSKRGSMHGIPISMKETVGVAGYDCTAGFSCEIDHNKAEDGILIKVLRKQGAVPFVFTNLSQAQMSVSCSNPIYGETCHPIKRDRTCGGSSGGEGALIGAGGSIVGIGCDAGGSNRIPAHFCGVCALKQSPNRSSGAGNMPFGEGMSVGVEIYGPIGRDVTACAELLKAALSPAMWELDPMLPKIPWREELYSSSKPMKIGYYIYDGGLEPNPAAKRCVLEAKSVLEKMGHQIVEFQPPNVQKAMEECFFAAMLGDNGEMLSAYLQGDVVDPSIGGAQYISVIPICVRIWLSKLLYFMHPTERAIIGAPVPGTVYEYQNILAKVKEYKHEFSHVWKSQDLDAVICPTFAIPAFQRGNEGSATASASYTALYNLVDFPAGTYPWGQVEQRDIEEMKNYPARNTAEKYVHSVMKDAEQLPIGVQCVSLPFMEEVALRVMKELEKGKKLYK